MAMIHDLVHCVVPVYALRWLAAVGLLLLCPTALLAHGTLIRSAPAVNTKVAKLPSEIHLWFNESLEHSFSHITVHRATRDPATGELTPQQRVDEGLAAGPRVTRELAVKLPDILPPGLYLVQWQVLSIDSHRTTGMFTLTYELPTDKAKPGR
jgi:methionine-rich copper-binding protein CopC